MQLTDGDEKCVLKLCMYKTPYGKSGHTYVIVVVQLIDIMFDSLKSNTD